MVGCVWVVLSLSFLPVFGEQKCAKGFYEQTFGHREHCYRIIAYDESALQNGKSQLEAGDERCKNLTYRTTDQGVVPRLLSVGSEEELRFIATLFFQARESSCSAFECAEWLPLGVLSSSGNGSVASFSSLDGSDVAFLERRFSETSIPAGKCIFYTPPHGIHMANCGGVQQTTNGGSGNPSKSASTRLLFAGCKYAPVGKRKPIRLRAGKVDAPKPGKETAGSVADPSRDKFNSDDGGPKAGADEPKDLRNKKPAAVKQDGDKSMPKVQSSAVKTDRSEKEKEVVRVVKRKKHAEYSVDKRAERKDVKKMKREIAEGEKNTGAVVLPGEPVVGQTIVQLQENSETKVNDPTAGMNKASANEDNVALIKSETSKTTRIPSPMTTKPTTTRPTTTQVAGNLKTPSASAVRQVGSNPKLPANNPVIVTKYRSLDAADENFLVVNDGPVAPLPNPPRMTESDRENKGVRLAPVSLFNALFVVVPFILHPTQ